MAPILYGSGPPWLRSFPDSGCPMVPARSRFTICRINNLRHSQSASRPLIPIVDIRGNGSRASLRPGPQRDMAGMHAWFGQGVEILEPGAQATLLACTGEPQNAMPRFTPPPVFSSERDADVHDSKRGNGLHSKRGNGLQQIVGLLFIADPDQPLQPGADPQVEVVVLSQEPVPIPGASSDPRSRAWAAAGGPPGTGHPSIPPPVTGPPGHRLIRVHIPCLP